MLPPVDTAGLFENIVPDILDLVEDQLEEMNRTRVPGSKKDVVLLVGGFGTSPYLQQALKARLGERADVLIPPDPNIAVLFGAVHFCYEPHTRARRSRFTYGCDVSQPFEEGVDPEDSRFVTEEGQVMCSDRFSRFVSAGETIPVDAEVTHRYLPLEGTQTSVTFTLYATKDPDPRYCTDCDEIGYFTADLTRVMRFAMNERGVRLHMRFGETEMKVRAVVELTGEEVAVTTYFHSNH